MRKAVGKKAEGKDLEIRMIPIDAIERSDLNRKIGGKDPETRELAESIKAQGMLVPMIVRPSAKGDGVYEILAGERRWVAARLAGLDRAPCIVRDMREADAHALRVTENLQRKDLSPLEQARQLRELENLGLSAEESAAKLGKSVSWVCKRRQLDKLIPDLRKALEGEKRKLDLTYFSAAQMELLARLPGETQARVLNNLEQKAQWCERIGLDGLREQMANELHLVKTAAWDPKAAYGPLPACFVCLKRSGCHPELFDEAAEGVRQDDQCLDAECWRKKAELYLAKRIEQERARHEGLTLVAGAYDGDTKPNREIDALEEWNYEKAKKGEQGARPALVVRGKGFGKQIWIKPNASGDREGASRLPGEERTVAEKKAQVDKLRRRIVVDLLAEAAAGEIAAWGLDLDGNKTDILAMTAAWGLTYSWAGSGQGVSKKPWDDLEGYRIDGGGGALAKLASEAARMIDRRLHAYFDDPNWSEVERVALFFDIDLDRLLALAAGKKPYPKAWRAEAEALPESEPKRRDMPEWQGGVDEDGDDEERESESEV